jgi:hypothetical protein
LLSKAEIKFVIKNEYAQIIPAVKAVKTAKQNLSKAKDAYSAYQQDLAQLVGLLSDWLAGLLLGWLAGLLSDWLVRLLSACLSFECLSFECLGTIAKNPLLLKKESDGKVSFTLATATIDKEAERSTKTTVQLYVDVFGSATDAIVCLDVNACCIDVVVGIKGNVVATEC